MNNKTKDTLKALSIPFILITIYLSMYLIWKLLGLPSDDQMIVLIKEYFSKYGLLVVFISAMIEGFFLLGQYFPGSVVIFLGVISAGKDIPRVIETVFVVSIAFFIAYTLNYLLGKYGFYIMFAKFGLKESVENSKNKLKKHGLNFILSSYWEPNLASITATAAGVLKIPLKFFLSYSIFGIILWNIFWGTFVYLFGEQALKLAGLKYILIIFFVWISLIIIKEYWYKRYKITHE